MTAVVLILCACAGCLAIMQEVVDTAVAQHATLQIDGNAQFVNLEYTLVDRESQAAPDIRYHVSGIGEHANPERLPMTRSFLVNPGDVLRLYCALTGTNNAATLRILVDNREQRSCELTPAKPNILMSHTF